MRCELIVDGDVGRLRSIIKTYELTFDDTWWLFDVTRKWDAWYDADDDDARV